MRKLDIDAAALLLAAGPDLLGALKRLTEASIADYGHPDESDSDDEAVALCDTGESAVKFGHLRDALRAIAKAEGK
jgi:hypothetical protein